MTTLEDVSEFLSDLGFEYRSQNDVFKLGMVRLRLYQDDEDGPYCRIYMTAPLTTSYEAEDTLYFESLEEFKSEIRTWILNDVEGYSRSFDMWVSTVNTFAEMFK